jgi:hypothetical protein
MTDDSSGFQWKDQNILSGNISGVSLTSQDFVLDDGSHNFSFQFEDYLPEYPVNGAFLCELWEGSTDRDYQRFNEIAITGNVSDPDWDTNVYAGVCSVAFTGHVLPENITNTGPATLVIGLDSDWISKYGWAYGYEVTSSPPGIRAYLDGQFIGNTPLMIPGTLSSGNHTLVLWDSHYTKQEKTLIVDKKPSIKVIRIGDDGLGDTLKTEFLSHDDEQNLDFFRAYSPRGLSTFGVVSTSRTGNPFQMLYLSLSHAVNSGGSGGGGGAGGGGGGGDNGVASSAGPQTTIATGNPTKEITAIPTITQMPEGSETGTTGSLPGAESPESETAGESEQTGTPHETGEQAGMSTAMFTEGTTAMVLLKNLSVVGVVVIVTVVFYFRWKREED